MTYLSHLRCSRCDKKYEANQVQTFCQTCQAPLLSCYDLAAARKHLDRGAFQTRQSGMWRWHELLPVFNLHSAISLGEGDTPLLLLRQIGTQYGLTNLFIKDESFNPTGSFKARGLSAAVSKAKELGIRKLIIPTAGNAGGALAAYAARAGLKATIVMPKDTPPSNIEESKIAGARVVLVDGLISDAAKFAGKMAQEEGWYDVSTFKEPYRTEGKKIMGFELAEAFNWILPNVIVYPTGGGTGLIGMWKAFAELQELGWLESSHRPRMIAVQASGCAPVVKAFMSGASSCEFWLNANTIAAGLRVPKSFADREILHDLKESNGTAIEVDDKEIVSAQNILASSEGIFAAPEGAATLAGLIKLVGRNEIHPDEKVVLFNTATGLKYLDHRYVS